MFDGCWWCVKVEMAVFGGGEGNFVERKRIPAMEMEWRRNPASE